MKHYYFLLLSLCAISLVQGEGLRGDVRLLASTELAEGIYVISFVSSGKVLDITGASTKAGTQLIQYSYNGGQNQKFKVVKVSSGVYKIIGVQSGLALDVNGASYTSGTPIIQWYENGQANQQWRAYPLQTCMADTAGNSSCSISGYTLVSVNSGLTLSVENGSTSDGARIVQASNPSQASCSLRFVPV